LNSNITADGLKLLHDMMKAQYVATKKKQKEKALKQKDRYRVEDTMSFLS